MTLTSLERRPVESFGPQLAAVGAFVGGVVAGGLVATGARPRTQQAPGPAP